MTVSVPGVTDVVCDDGIFCTDETCAPAVGCVVSHPEKPCNDSNFCTIGEKCLGGFCQDPESILPCDDGNPARRIPVPRVVDAHTPTMQTFVTTVACARWVISALGSCSGFTSNLNCDDGSPCTIDSCDTLQACFHTHINGACEDGNECTANDVCFDGQCIGGSNICGCSTDEDLQFLRQQQPLHR